MVDDSILVPVACPRKLKRSFSYYKMDCRGEVIDKEYQRWLVVRSMGRVFANISKDRKKIYSAQTVLERILLLTADASAGSDLLSAFGDNRNKYILQNNIDSLVSRGVCSPTVARSAVKKIAMLAMDYLAAIDDNLRYNAVPEVEANGKIKYGQFTCAFAFERIKILLGIATPRDAVVCVLRYACIIPRGQHWSIPMAIYKNLVQRYGINLEGFASPFNSQLLKIYQDNPRYNKPARFCSLFPDTDAVYGSVGNFFAQDLVGQHTVINPPFIAELMERTTRKCIADASRAATSADMLAIIVVPKWEDTDWFRALINCPQCVKIAYHEPFKHYYEDSNANDAKVDMKICSAWIVIATGTPAKYDFGYLDTMYAVQKYRR